MVGVERWRVGLRGIKEAELMGLVNLECQKGMKQKELGRGALGFYLRQLDLW